MRVNTTQIGIALFVLLMLARSGAAQSSPQASGAEEPFTLVVPVNEVSLTFHVSDAHGNTIDGLRKEDLKLFDNGKLQSRVVEFQAYRDLPIRAGFLMDTSVSMQSDAQHSLEIATEYLARFFRKETDRAFVMRFDVETNVAEGWNNNTGVLADGLHAAANEAGLGADGTAIFDSIYKACRDQWPANSDEVTGNFILLFTDGLDNSSHASIADVIDRCQRSRTAIYVFVNEWKARASRGQQTLIELVTKSGGRIFFKPNDEQMETDLQMIESDQRSQYRLVYKPYDLKRDNSFHRIKLICSVERSEVLTRSGYYAATRR